MNSTLNPNLSPSNVFKSFNDKFIDDPNGDSIIENELLVNRGPIQIVKDEHRNLFIRIKGDIDVS